MGGYCLPKDSLLLASSFSQPNAMPRLSMVARTINEQASRFPLEIFERFCSQVGHPEKSMNALVIGIAFKGEPETNDLRGSSGLVVAYALQEKGVKVTIWDAVVTNEEIVAAGLKPVLDLDEAVIQADCVFLMNNHRKNSSIDVTKLNRKSHTKLVFDGWGLFDREETEAVKGLCYSSPGYMTPLLES